MKVSNWLVDKMSYSKVACMYKCPRLFWYRYIMKRRADVTPWLLFGRGAHGGQEACNLAKLRGERMSVPQVLDAAVAEFEAEVEKEGWGMELKDAFAEEHERQLEVYSDSGEWDKVRPVEGTVEGGYQIELMVGDGQGNKAPCVVEGFVDVVSQERPDAPKVVIDYKSSGRPASDREVANHIQLGLNAIGSEAESAQIVSFVKGGKQKPTTKVSKAHAVGQNRWERVLAWFAEGIQAIRKAVKSGDFPKCDTSCHWCSAEACEMYHLCYPEKLSDLHKYVEVGEIRPSGTLPPAEWRMSKAARKEAERAGQ